MQRNHPRSRRRYLRARSFPLVAGCDLREGERHTVGASEGEDIPAALPGVHLDLPEHFSPPFASLDPRLTLQSAKRLGDPFDLGSNKERRTEKNPEESDLDEAAMDVVFSGGAKRLGLMVHTAQAADLSSCGLPVTDADNR